MRLYNQLVQSGDDEGRKRRKAVGRGISVWRPYSWPRMWRRIGIVTFPLAIVVWFVFAILSIVHLAYQDARKPLKRFWNAPSRRSGYGYFRY